jgi:hypothetical protein
MRDAKKAETVNQMHDRVTRLYVFVTKILWVVQHTASLAVAVQVT